MRSRWIWRAADFEMVMTSDEQLMLQFQQGSREAFAELKIPRY
jgi:hypothetical protein